MSAPARLVLFLCVACAAIAQPARLKVLSIDYPSNEMAGVFFWIERKEGVEKPWVTMSVVDPASGTNAMAFYRVGVDWRKNAPDWMTNFQFEELPPAPIKAKALTAGSKTGKLPTSVPLPPKTFRALPPMPQL